MIEPLMIGSRKVGPGQPVYVIAELSANHGGSLERAMALVRAAKIAGADAVKLQTYTADTITLESDDEPFRISGGTLWDGRTLHQLYREAYTPWEWHAPLKRLANELGLDLFSSPFDETAVELLEELDMPAYKIASFELVDTPLIERVARTKRPMIMSTGMATFEEIADAVEAARKAGAVSIALLRCTSAYPAPPEEMNLKTIPDLARRFEVPVGLSDHTLGITVPIAAVALGASIVEKHLTLSRADGGPDSAFSLEPPELAQMVQAIRVAEKALGEVRYQPGREEKKSRPLRRSLFVVRDVAAGELFTRDSVRSIRPGHGLPPKLFERVIGRPATIALRRGTPMSLEHVAWEDK